MSAISTHILDISTGKPASGVPVTLEFKSQASGWEKAGSGETDNDGRVINLLGEKSVLLAGHYRIVFDTAIYFIGQEIEAFYPQVTVMFTVRDANQHYHVPLLLCPFGYSTYRGS
jgi:5-hydroxyisourate hydrolase